MSLYDCSPPAPPKHHTLGALIHRMAHRIVHPFEHPGLVCGEVDIPIVTVTAAVPDVPALYPPSLTDVGYGGAGGYALYPGGGYGAAPPYVPYLQSYGTPHEGAPARPQSVPEPGGALILLTGVVVIIVTRFARASAG